MDHRLVESNSFFGDAFLRLLHYTTFTLKYTIEGFGKQTDYFIFTEDNDFVQLNDETIKKRVKFESVCNDDFDPLTIDDYSYDTEESSEEEYENNTVYKIVFPLPSKIFRIECEGTVEDILDRIKNIQFVLNRLKEIEISFVDLTLSKEFKDTIIRSKETDMFIKCLLSILIKNESGLKMFNKINEKIKKYTKFMQTYVLYRRAHEIIELMAKVSELDETLENNLPRHAIIAIEKEREIRGKLVENTLDEYGLDLQEVYDYYEESNLFIECFSC